jgi:hypothetical protein
MWWDPFRSTGEAWLSEGDVRGDALKSLRSQDNTLSIYLVDDDEPKGLERVIAAFAAQRESLANVDFALLQLDQLESHGFVLETLAGVTPDVVVNTWHRDLVRLSGARILGLAELLQGDAAFCRRRKPEIKRLVKSGIDVGWIDTSKMRQGLLDELTRS